MAEVDPELAPYIARLERACVELDKRAAKANILEDYADNANPLGRALTDAAKNNGGAHQFLTALAKEPWAGKVVDSVTGKLFPQGVRWFSDSSTAAAWSMLQRNGIDGEWPLLCEMASTTGRAFAIVWDENGDGLAEITVESPRTCIVEYAPGSRTRRVSAVRRWFDADDDRWYATLFLPGALYKFASKKTGEAGPSKWVPHEVPGEEWPLPNPIGTVPVVEFAVNRRHRDRKPHRFGSAFGDFERATAIIDRLQFTVFGGLAGLTWAGFMALLLIGDPIVHKKKADGSLDLDADGNPQPIAPFELGPGRIQQIVNKDARVETIDPKDMRQFLEFAASDLQHLASVTSTPVYELSAGNIVNVGPEGLTMIRESHFAKLWQHSRGFGDALAEVVRLGFAVEGDEAGAAYFEGAVDWKDFELTSLAARGDYAAKLSAAGFPWQVVAPEALDWSDSKVQSAQTVMDSAQLVAAATAVQNAAQGGQ